MMNLDPAIEEAIQNNYERAHLVTMNLNGITLYYTDNGIDIEYNGDTYLANGLLLDMGEPRYTSDLRVNETELAFSAADLTTISLMLNNSQFNRLITVERVYFNSAGEIIGTPIPLVNLLNTGYGIQDVINGNDAAIILKMASEFSAWEKSRGRRTTPASQRRFFPNDKGMEFAASVKPQLKWGSQ